MSMRELNSPEQRKAVKAFATAIKALRKRK